MLQGRHKYLHKFLRRHYRWKNSIFQHQRHDSLSNSIRISLLFQIITMKCQANSSIISQNQGAIILSIQRQFPFHHRRNRSRELILMLLTVSGGLFYSRILVLTQLNQVLPIIRYFKDFLGNRVQEMNHFEYPQYFHIYNRYFSFQKAILLHQHSQK